MSPDRLAEIPLFAGLDAAQRERMTGVLSVVRYEAGDEVLAQGANGQSLWVLLDGKCRVVSRPTADCEAVVLAELEPPAHFGEMSFFQRSSHSAGVRALTALELLRLERQDFDRLIAAGDPAAYQLTLNVVEVLAERLRRMDEWVTELICKQSDRRQVSEWSRFRQTLFGSSGV